MHCGCLRPSFCSALSGLEKSPDEAHIRGMAANGKIDRLKTANIALVVGTVLFCVVLLFFVGK
jgi:hypothetical protein